MEYGNGVVTYMIETRMRGIRVDEEKAAALKEFKNKEQQVLNEIKQQTTMDVDIWAAKISCTSF